MKVDSPLDKLSEAPTRVNILSVFENNVGGLYGLHAALHMDWRKESTKVCVLIADAPPHGLESSRDGFPNGCPDGHDQMFASNFLTNSQVPPRCRLNHRVFPHAWTRDWDFLVS